jgi:flagellum-specific peptidoglycan hydrolase FlgJ
MSAAAKLIKAPDDIEGVIIFAQANLEKNIRSMAQEDKNLFVKKMARKINEV